MKEKKEWRPKKIICDEIIKDSEKIKFIYKSVQQKLESTIYSHNFIEKKILLLLSYLIISNTFLIGYVIKNYNEKLHFFAQKITFYHQLLIIILLFLLISIALVILSRPKKFHYKGNDPSHLIDAKCCSQKNNDLILDEIILYEERIRYNQKITAINGFLINIFLLIILIIIPILFLF